MDKEAIREALNAMLSDVANKARQDALRNESDIGSIYRDDNTEMQSMNAEAIEEAISDINKATATKEGARRLINGIVVAAKVAVKLAYPS